MQIAKVMEPDSKFENISIIIVTKLWEEHQDVILHYQTSLFQNYELTRFEHPITVDILLAANPEKTMSDCKCNHGVAFPDCVVACFRSLNIPNIRIILSLFKLFDSFAARRCLIQ